MVRAQDYLHQEREEGLRTILNNPKLHQELLDHAQPMREDFNYTSLLEADTDVLLVGEEHHDDIARRDVNLMIKQLAAKRGKLTHVATEFLLSAEQPLLDQFMAGKITYAELKEKVELGRRAFVAEIAKRYHVNIVGLDLARAQENPGWATSVEGFTQRNQAWTDIILTIKQHNPRAKFLLHAGSFHTQLTSKYIPTMPHLLQQNGLKTKSVEFANSFDSMWKYLASPMRYDTLFTIPENLRPLVNADYVVYTVHAEFSEKEKQKISKWVHKHYPNPFFDYCFQDPDNPLCKIHIRSARVKK